MHISILSVFPEMYQQFLNTSLVKRAQDAGQVSITTHSFFSEVAPKKRIDAPTFGCGDGMLLKPEIIEKAYNGATQNGKKKLFRVFFSPQGEKLNQHLLKEIYKKSTKCDGLLLVASRYEGMDARVEQEYADMHVSVGDFVLMGGDLPAMMLTEGLLRLVPEVVGKESSVEQDSFSGPFVDYPEYTAPVEWKGLRVPDVIRSGDHKEVARWRKDQAVKKTVQQHFSWLRKHHLSDLEKIQCKKYMPAHYIALCHSNVRIGPEKVSGTTSVTSMDIHDVARSSNTYGIDGFFIVTPLWDQQKIVQRFLSFWKSDHGAEYNRGRQESVSLVEVVIDLEKAIEVIEKKEGVRPIIVGTTAREFDLSLQRIHFDDQDKLWQKKKPILFLFGTGKGFTDELLQKCDYLLAPITGLSTFNHLSVRSAIAIVLDRWLGIDQKYK